MSIAQAALDMGAAPAAPITTGETSEVATDAPLEVKGDPRFDLISKMERKIKQRESELAQKMKEIEEKSSRYGRYEGVESKVKENPLEALRELGFEGGLEELQNWALQNMNDEDLDPVSKRFKEMEAKFAEKDKEYEEKLRKAIEEKEKEITSKESEYQIKEFKNGIKSFLEQSKDEFELLYSQPEANDLVYEVIYEDVLRQQQAGKQDIVPMELKDAAERLEKYLDAQLEPLLKSKKIQSKFKNPDSWMEAYQSKATINADMTASSLPHAEELSPAQRAELAIRKLKEGKYPQE
jgi:hypothetical protein